MQMLIERIAIAMVNSGRRVYRVRPVSNFIELLKNSAQDIAVISCHGTDYLVLGDHVDLHTLLADVTERTDINVLVDDSPYITREMVATPDMVHTLNNVMMYTC